MKVIKTANFLKKQAQYGDLPGDPGLPPGVTNQMIDKQFGDNEPTNYSKQAGELETKIDWTRTTTELITAGYDVRGLPQTGMGDIQIYYQYNADVSGSEVQIKDLRVLDIKVWMGGQYQPLTTSSLNIKEGIFEGFQDEIALQEQQVIQEQHEGSIDYGPDTSEELY